MLSAEGGDLGLDESNASMSLTSEGVRGLLVLLRLVDGPRDGLQDRVICQQQCMGSKEAEDGGLLLARHGQYGCLAAPYVCSL